MKEKKTIIVVSAIAALTILECVAMYKGINGTLFTIIAAAIAGIAGLSLPQPKILK